MLSLMYNLIMNAFVNHCQSADYSVLLSFYVCVCIYVCVCLFSYQNSFTCTYDIMFDCVFSVFTVPYRPLHTCGSQGGRYCKFIASSFILCTWELHEN